MSRHNEEECGVCHEELIEYKCCPKCGGETVRITHVSYDNIYFLSRGKWNLRKEKARHAYSNRYQCMSDACGWTSWPDKK